MNNTTGMQQPRVNIQARLPSTWGAMLCYAISTMSEVSTILQYLNLWTVLVPVQYLYLTRKSWTLEHMTKEQSVSRMWHDAKKRVPRGFQSEPALRSSFKSVYPRFQWNTATHYGKENEHEGSQRLEGSGYSASRKTLWSVQKTHGCVCWTPRNSVGVLIKCQSWKNPLSVEKSSSAARTQMWRWYTTNHMRHVVHGVIWTSSQQVLFSIAYDANVCEEIVPRLIERLSISEICYFILPMYFRLSRW